MHWPDNVHLVGTDLEPGMIARVWPGNSARRTAVCADWLSLPFADGSFDFAVGDGCLVLLEYPRDYQCLLASVRRCLAPHGSFLLRVFCRPEKAETLTEISDALEQRLIGSFDAFKWRLAMAVQGDQTAGGVALSAVWQAWRMLVPDPEEFAREQGWPLQKVLVIDAYRDNAACYCYPTLDEVREIFRPMFREVWCKHGPYELGDRCPRLLFQPANG